MNIDMTRTGKNNPCSQCKECRLYHDELIYCLGDKRPCWNWEYDRKKDPRDPAYLSPHDKLVSVPLESLTLLVDTNRNLMRMMQYKEEAKDV